MQPASSDSSVYAAAPGTRESRAPMPLRDGNVDDQARRRLGLPRIVRVALG